MVKLIEIIDFGIVNQKKRGRSSFPWEGDFLTYRIYSKLHHLVSGSPENQLINELHKWHMDRKPPAWRWWVGNEFDANSYNIRFKLSEKQEATIFKLVWGDYIVK